MAALTDTEIAQLYERHVDTVYRVCFAYMKNAFEAEDAVQDTFIRYLRAAPALNDAQHEKAWLIRTSGNICKDLLRRARRLDAPLDDDLPGESSTTDGGVLDAVLSLPEKYKTVVVLYYYEGYDSAEIAKLLRKPGATVRSHLREARLLLKKQLGDEFFETQ